MKLDILNISIEGCKDLIFEYQKTKDPLIFQDILGKLDKYLVYLVHKFSRKFYYLSEEQFQELYHIAIVALEKSILSLPKRWNSEGIYLWVGSYIKQSFKKNFEYKRFEIPLDDICKHVETNEENRNKVEKKCKEVIRDMDSRLMIFSNILTDIEKEYIVLKYYEGLELKDIAKIKGVRTGTVDYHIRKGLKKLKHNILKEEKMVTENYFTVFIRINNLNKEKAIEALEKIVQQIKDGNLKDCVNNMDCLPYEYWNCHEEKS